MKIDANKLLPNTKLMMRVAVTFVFLAVSFGVIFAEHAEKKTFPILIFVVWGLGFAVIFAIIYVIWLIYYAFNVYKAQEQLQKMEAFQNALDGKPKS